MKKHLGIVKVFNISSFGEYNPLGCSIIANFESTVSESTRKQLLQHCILTKIASFMILGTQQTNHICDMCIAPKGMSWYETCPVVHSSMHNRLGYGFTKKHL